MVRGDNRISDDDIGVCRLMGLLFSMAWRQAARAQDLGLHGRSLCASKSARARINLSYGHGFLKCESKGVKRLQGLNWKEVKTMVSVLATGVIWLDMVAGDYGVKR